MNFKAQFGKNIHKLPSGISSFQELIYSIRQLLGKKLPENYTFKYSDTDNDLVGLESQDDFEAAFSFLKANNINSLKVLVVKETKPSLEQFTLPPDFSFMSCSSIIRQAVEEQPPQKEKLTSPEIREQIPESNIVEVESKMKDQSEAIEKVTVENQQTDSISKDQNLKEDKISQEIQEEKQSKNQANLSINRLPQNREELQQLVEEIVEEKLRNLLQNYQLIPKYLAQDNQNKRNPKNESEEEERKENASEMMDLNSNIQLEEKNTEKDKFSEIDKKKLRAILKSDPESEIKVSSGSPYVWSFVMYNSGTQSWPLNTFFQCVQGPNINQKIEVGGIKPSSQFNIVLPLDAPFNPDKYPEVWSLVYDTDDRQTVTFGPKVRYTLVVSPVISQPTVSNPSKPQSSQSSISITQTTEQKVNNKTIELANKMKGILGGDLKQYVEFLSISDHCKLSPDDAINTYLENKKF